MPSGRGCSARCLCAPARRRSAGALPIRRPRSGGGAASSPPLIPFLGEVLAGARESPQGEPRPVDEVAPPPPIPGSFGVLPAVQIRDGAPDRLDAAPDADPVERLERAPGDVLAARVDHGVVVRERDERQHLVVAVAVEGGPAAVAVLHRELPGHAALDRPLPAPLVALVGKTHGGQRRQHFRRVVGIGIELVLVLEVPAAGGRLRDPPLPVPGHADFAVEQPARRAQQARIVFRDARLPQRDHRERRVPDRGEAGLQANRLFLLDLQLLQLFDLALHRRVIGRVAAAAQREDRVDDRREDRSEPVAPLETLEDPRLGPCQRPPAQGSPAPGLQLVEEPVHPAEEGSPEPRAQAPRPPLRLRRALRRPELGERRALRDGTARAICRDDREGHHDRAGPGGHPIDRERHPVRQQDELRRDGRASLPIVLSEDREINLREGVARVQPAMLADDAPRLRHVRGFGVVADELQGEVGLRRGAHLRRASRVDRPAPRRELLAPQVLGRLPDPVLPGAPEEMHRQHVLGLEDRVPLELAAPVAVLALDGEEVPAGRRRGVVHPECGFHVFLDRHDSLAGAVACHRRPHCFPPFCRECNPSDPDTRKPISGVYGPGPGGDSRRADRG